MRFFVSFIARTSSRCKHRAVRTDLTEHGDDLIEILVVQQRAALAHGAFGWNAELRENQRKALGIAFCGYDELQVITVRRRRKRTAREKGAASFHAAFRLRARFAVTGCGHRQRVGRGAVETRSRDLRNCRRIGGEHACKPRNRGTLRTENAVTSAVTHETLA